MACWCDKVHIAFGYVKRLLKGPVWLCETLAG